MPDTGPLRPDVSIEDPESADARGLLAALDGEIAALYPEAQLVPARVADLLPAGGAFVVARIEGRAVACGALRRREPGVFEIKRMYVRPEQRRQGVAGRIIAALEALAAERGARRIVVETGFRQPDAAALYEKAGYVPVDCFGEFAGKSYSRCFEKKLRR